MWSKVDIRVGEDPEASCNSRKKALWKPIRLWHSKPATMARRLRPGPS
jgi:hypothetical protein